MALLLKTCEIRECSSPKKSDASFDRQRKPDLGRGMGKKGWIREKPALDTIQSDFLMDGYPPLENRDGFGGL